jgi:hypothetical protein
LAGTSAIKVETCGVRVPARTVDSIRCRNGLCIDEAGGEVPFQTRPAVQIPYSYKGKLVFRAIILSVGILSLSMDIADELAFLPIFSAGFPNGSDVVDVSRTTSDRSLTSLTRLTYLA